MVKLEHDPINRGHPSDAHARKTKEARAQADPLRSDWALAAAGEQPCGGFHDLRRVGVVQLRRVRMIVADRLHQIAGRFIQIGAHDQPGSGDVEADGSADGPGPLRASSPV